MKYPWMPIFWGDFLANTMHLSAQEAGAYLFLIAHAWENEGEIPGDWIRLARIAHVRQNHWKSTWKALEQFFEPLYGESLIRGYSHKRVLIELHRLGKISNKRKAAALQMHSKSSASAEQTTPLTTSTSNREAFLNGKGSEAATVHVQVNYRDPGVGYRSPPAQKSDNVLEPLPDNRSGKRKRVAEKGEA
jgi:uncharacterized protein YdaU (DUF1376 family)